MVRIVFNNNQYMVIGAYKNYELAIHYVDNKFKGIFNVHTDNDLDNLFKEFGFTNENIDIYDGDVVDYIPESLAVDYI